MGQPSFAASNAIIYVTYGAFLLVADVDECRIEWLTSNRLMGTGIAWTLRNQPKAEFLAGNRTQTGQEHLSRAWS